MIQQIERRLNNDTNLLIERKGNALLYYILFPNAFCLKQMQWKQNPTFSRTPSARFFPMNRPLTPIMKPTITVKCVPSTVFNPKRKTILDLSDDPDHSVEQTSSTISWLSKKKSKTHDCTICYKTGHNEVHCNWYCCKHCNLIGVRHLPIECPVFLTAPIIPIHLTSTQPWRGAVTARVILVVICIRCTCQLKYGMMISRPRGVSLTSHNLEYSHIVI